MTFIRLLAVASVAFTASIHAQTVSYAEETSQWRARAESSLKRDTGWLTLAGRWELKQGKNRVGSARDNDIVFPAGVAPDYLGAVDVVGTKATLTLNDGVQMFSEIKNTGEAFSKREFDTAADKMQWVHLDRLALTTFKHPAGKMILRIADQQNPVRAQFAGRVWYDVKAAMNIDAQFVPAAKGKKQKIVNVLGEITDENVAGRVEFLLNGKKISLDALGDEKDQELFIIFNDASADGNGNGTYPAGRFLVVKRPENGNKTKIDFNRAYNPPCAFSAFTSCPLPPAQNQLKVRVEAGEKYRGA